MGIVLRDSPVPAGGRSWGGAVPAVPGVWGEAPNQNGCAVGAPFFCEARFLKFVVLGGVVCGACMVKEKDK